MRRSIVLATPVLAALVLLAACQKQEPKEQPPYGTLPVEVVRPEAMPAQPAAEQPGAETPAPAQPTPEATLPEAKAAPEPQIAASAPSTAPAPPAPKPPPPPRPGSGPFIGNFHLMGTEPFWNVTIQSGGITLQRPDRPDVSASNPGPVVTGNSATWTGRFAQSRLIVTLTHKTCSDGMSDRVYAYEAEVQIWGTVLKGCGAAG